MHTTRTATTSMLLAAAAGAIGFTMPNALADDGRTDEPTTEEPTTTSEEESTSTTEEETTSTTEEESTSTTVEESTSTTEAPTTTVVEMADPAAPTISSVTAKATALSVAWTAPEDQSAGTVLLYQLFALKDDAVKATTVVSADVLKASLSGLTNGTTYDVVVLPFTTKGVGVPSLPMVGTPTAESPVIAAASAVQDLVGSRGRGFATVGWAPPVDDGGSAVTGYAVVTTDATSGALVSWRNVKADQRSASVSGLTGGKTYKVHVLPITSAGFGGVADPYVVKISSTAVTLPKPPTVSGASAVVVDAAKGDYAVVTVGPAVERGEALVRYHVVAIQDDEFTAWRVIGPNDRQTTVPVGTDGEAQIYVFAESASGFGPHLDPISVSAISAG